jgi:hypothetical protein
VILPRRGGRARAVSVSAVQWADIAGKAAREAMSQNKELTSIIFSTTFVVKKIIEGFPMPSATAILREPAEVDRRLHEMDLSKDGLVEVIRRAAGAYRDSTLNDPANAAGQFSYIFGTRALRDIHLGTLWVLDRRDSVEGIRHADQQLKIVFQNVDCACDANKSPRPRSPKGAGSERACEGNQGHLFGELPQYVVGQIDGFAIYYLMVSINGQEVRAELSRPVIKDQTFASFVERIFIVDDDQLDESDVTLPNHDVGDDSDVAVSRK